MADVRVARRYAQALLNAATKMDVVRPVEDDLAAIVGLLDSDPDFRHFLLAPYTSREEKIRIAGRLFSDRVTALTMQALRVMLDKRREAELPFVRSEYVRLRREKEGVVLAVVTSAEELDDDQRRRLAAKLETVLGKTVEAEYRLDPRLIGGVRVAYDNNVLDGSVRGTLARLREKLRRDLLRQA